MTKIHKPSLLILTIALLSLLTSGCAMMSKADCLEGDWRAAGFTDATRGYTTSRLAPRTRACAKHGETPNKIAYQLGYRKGLEDYCQPERGLYEGSRNADYRGICPSDTERPFLTQYIYGLQIARNEVSHRFYWLESNLFNARHHRLRVDDTDLHYRLTRRIDRLDNRLDNLRTKRFQINRKIALWNAHLNMATNTATQAQ